MALLSAFASPSEVKSFQQGHSSSGGPTMVVEVELEVELEEDDVELLVVVELLVDDEVEDDELEDVDVLEEDVEELDDVEVVVVVGRTGVPRFQSLAVEVSTRI
jgi:hypothetical protein